jgi:hypothetical protein
MLRRLWPRCRRSGGWRSGASAPRSTGPTDERMRVERRFHRRRPGIGDTAFFSIGAGWRRTQHPEFRGVFHHCAGRTGRVPSFAVETLAPPPHSTCVKWGRGASVPTIRYLTKNPVPPPESFVAPARNTRSSTPCCGNWRCSAASRRGPRCCCRASWPAPSICDANKGGRSASVPMPSRMRSRGPQSSSPTCPAGVSSWPISGSR